MAILQTIDASESASQAAEKINGNFTALNTQGGGGGGGSTPTGIIAQNEDAVNHICAAKRHFDTRNSFTAWETTSNDNCFCIAHGSDFHYDTARYGRFRDFIDGVSLINAAVVSGDITDQGSTTEMEGMLGVAFTRIQPMQVIGNHERWGGKTIAEISQGLGQPTIKIDGVDTYTGYYSVDYPTQKIRIIVLNEYDTSLTTKASGAPKNGAWTSVQIDWFIGVLDDAITNDYSVIVCRHGIENADRPAANNKPFYQRAYAWAGVDAANNNYACNGKIIESIINAFRNKSSISQTYSFNNGSNAAITVSHTFTGNGKFVCYIVGHSHIDNIGYSSTYSDQLYLGIPQGCLSGGYSGHQVKNTVSDLPRIAGTKSEDCINVYGIDTVNKLVKVVRVGADMNDLMEPREVACFEYEPTNS